MPTVAANVPKFPCYFALQLDTGLDISFKKGTAKVPLVRYENEGHNGKYEGHNGKIKHEGRAQLTAF